MALRELVLEVAELCGYEGIQLVSFDLPNFEFALDERDSSNVSGRIRRRDVVEFH